MWSRFFFGQPVRRLVATMASQRVNEKSFDGKLQESSDIIEAESGAHAHGHELKRQLKNRHIAMIRCAGIYNLQYIAM